MPVPDALELKIATFALGLRAEWIQADEVIAWADSLIESEEQPHPAILDVSLAPHDDQYELARALDGILRNRQVVVPEAHLLSAMAEVLERHPGRGEAIARHCWEFGFDRRSPDAKAVDPLEMAHYLFGEARDDPQHHSVADALGTLRECLAPYRRAGNGGVAVQPENPG